MRYRKISPQGAASEFVDCYWALECDGSGPAEEQRVVPDGRAELIVNLGRPFESLQNGQWREQPQCFLAGQITGPLLLRPQGHARILGVRFRPQGAGQVLGVPMQELTGRMVPVADLSTALSGAIEITRESGSFQQIEAAMRSVCREPDLLVAEAVRQIATARGSCNLAQLARRLGISTRQFERRFEGQVGMPPKLFCRIQRFQRVFLVIEEGRANWVSAAVECGYYDQAHLIRDFTDFSGKTPAVLLAGDDLARHFVSPGFGGRRPDVAFLQDGPLALPVS
ncbi:MAG TPA: AraC family transcriptional regulator [Bryobacteraceae bacterium]